MTFLDRFPFKIPPESKDREVERTKEMTPTNLKRALKLIVLRRIRNRRRRIRSIYIRNIFQKRVNLGESILGKELRDDPYYHFRYFRMNKENYDEILRSVSKWIQPAKTHRFPISTADKLSLTLRYLATGNSQISMGLSYRISPQHVSQILKQVMEAISGTMASDCLPVPTMETWKVNEEGFRKTWNFPNAVGAMDGKHVRIRCPSFSGSTNFNYKNYFSIVLLAIVDPTYRFTLVDIGHSGSQSDGGIYLRSPIGGAIESGNIGIPSPKVVGNTLLPHVILTDDAFSLKPHNMKPFPGKFLPKDERIFNYRLSRARMVVENAFGILSARWRIFHTSIIADVKLVKLIVRTSVILHNFLISRNDLNNITVDTPDHANGNWREAISSDDGYLPLNQQGSNNYSKNAAETRNSFKDYFMTEGAVNWQNDRV